METQPTIRKIALCVDPGTQETGWKVLDNQGLEKWGGSTKLNKKMTFLERAHVLTGRLEKLFHELGQTHREPGGVAVERYLVIEKPFVGKNPAGAITSAMLFGVLCFYFHKNGFRVIEVAPTELKKFATGNGKAKKEAMLAAIPQELHITNHNHGDAFWIGEWWKMIDKLGAEPKKRKIRKKKIGKT